MIKILTSLLDTYKEVNGEKKVKEIDNNEGFITLIKKYLKGNVSILFIASTPNDFEKVDMYSSLLFESLKLSGIIFDEYNVLDSRTIERTGEFIDKADFIFLSGGNTFLQSEFFEKIKLKELLKNYDGIIVGQSAGSINMAKNVFNSPEQGENSEPIYLEGLGLTEINIEPHWKTDTSKFDEYEKYQREYILEESKKRDIYALCDGSYITIIDNEINMYGKIYKIKNGSIFDKAS